MNYSADYWTSLTRAAWNVPSIEALKRFIPATARNPAGSGNSKTELPGTYRPVGATCPATCEALNNGCYAQVGRVHMSAIRAAADAVLSARAAVFAMVAAVRYGAPARLHVSGDFATPDGSVDAEYVNALCAIGAELQRLSGADVVAYTYTHFDAATFGEYHERLAAVGIVVRWSGSAGAWGAINGAHGQSHAKAARANGATYCPQQAAEDVGRKVSCAECALCWTNSRPVYFRAHGQSAKRLPGTALAIVGASK